MRQLFMFFEFRLYLVVLLIGAGLYLTYSIIMDHAREECRSKSSGKKDGYSGIELDRRSPDDSDAEFIDENGNHIYYERSLIEKKKFHQQNPDIPFSSLRTFRRLFRHL